MPEKNTIERARKDAREGKAPSTQAGEFVREEIEHIREGKHGARSTKQAIAIGLSKARRAGRRGELTNRNATMPFGIIAVSSLIMPVIWCIKTTRRSWPKLLQPS